MFVFGVFKGYLFLGDRQCWNFSVICFSFHIEEPGFFLFSFLEEVGGWVCVCAWVKKQKVHLQGETA